jgi:hypothetical protein
MTSVRTASPEPSISDNTQQKSNNIQLTIHTTYLNRNCIVLSMIFFVLENVRKQLMFYFHHLIIEQPGKRVFLKLRKLFVSEFLFNFKTNFYFCFRLVEVAAGRRNISFQNVLTLPHSRPGSQVCFFLKIFKIES